MLFSLPHTIISSTSSFVTSNSPSEEQKMLMMLTDAKNFAQNDRYLDAYKLYEKLATLNGPFLEDSNCAKYRAEAQYQCGIMLRNGHKDVEQDIDKAIDFFNLASKSGLSEKVTAALNALNDKHHENYSWAGDNLDINSQLDSQTDINQCNIRNSNLSIGTYLTPNIPLRTNGVFASKRFIPNTTISTMPADIQKLISDGTLVPTQINVQDIAGKVDHYTLQEHGFEVRHVSEMVHKSLKLLQDITYIQEQEDNGTLGATLRSALSSNVKSLMHTLGYTKNVRVVALDTIIRNTNTSALSYFQRQINVFHTDFPPGKQKETVDSLMDVWGPRFVENNIDLNENKIVKMINIWMPLDEQVMADPLVLIDQNDIKEDSMEQTSTLLPNGKSIHSMVVKEIDTPYSAKYLSSLKLGECYIFDSTGTPHSAVPIEGQSSDGRRSVEVRFLILEPKPTIRDTIT